MFCKQNLLSFLKLLKPKNAVKKSTLLKEINDWNVKNPSVSIIWKILVSITRTFNYALVALC